MIREHDNTQPSGDTSLRFWFKGEQDRLIDEISGNSIIINQNLMVWDTTRQAYKFNKPSSDTNKYVAHCECDIGITQLPVTAIADVYPYSAGTNVALLDTWPTRQAMFGIQYRYLTSNQWNRVAVIWEYTANTATAKRYVNGILKLTNTYTSDGSYNKYQGVALDFTNQWSGDWGVFFGKNFRLYNRILTLDEIAAL